jgi:hypothetical protein
MKTAGGTRGRGNGWTATERQMGERGGEEIKRRKEEDKWRRTDRGK